MEGGPWQPLKKGMEKAGSSYAKPAVSWFLVSVPSSGIWMREMLFIVEENQVRSYMSRVSIHKSTDLDGMCLRVLREPAYVFQRLFSVMFGRLW